MIYGWEKRDDYWTNINSPGFCESMSKIQGIFVDPKARVISDHHKSYQTLMLQYIIIEAMQS